MEKRIKDDWNVFLVVLLSVLTCGIYWLYVLWRIIGDLNRIYGANKIRRQMSSPSFPMLILYTWLSCGVYMLYWIYAQGNKMQECGKRMNIEIRENGVFYLVMMALSPFTCYLSSMLLQYILIENFNTLAYAYNSSFGAGAAPADDDFTDKLQKKGKAFAGKLSESMKRQPLPEQTGILAGAGQIVGENGIYAGVQIDVKDNDHLVIGRDGLVSNLVVEDQAVSRQHCRIRYSALEQRYYITDLSTNGTFLGNGIRLEKDRETAAVPGTKIILGKSRQSFLLK